MGKSVCLINCSPLLEGYLTRDIIAQQGGALGTRDEPGCLELDTGGCQDDSFYAVEYG